ncbi:Crp/Fnr family transcriptional regulator [Egicoccus sp. AB-alg2]|uniref:Crp/Fnr family transcriptional regulator n=1 Tax=Egicoccus sp. AB-alg2 TaxID=3242693 RepID=UPI00359E401C
MRVKTVARNGRGLDGQPPPARRSLAGLLSATGQAQERTIAAGSLIAREGTRPAEVSVVTAGLLELSRHVASRRVTFDLVHPGEAFGDIEVLTGGERASDIRALVPSRLLSVDVGTFVRLLSTNTTASFRWLLDLAERVALADARLGERSTATLEGRLALILLEESRGGEVALTQTTLGGLLGVHRSSVNRGLKHLAARQLIAAGYGRIRILDRSGLERVVEAGTPPVPTASPQPRP